MQIGVPTQFMTDVQFESVDEKIPNAKSDAGCCFLPAYSGYWKSYIVGRIQNWLWGPWSVGTGIHICWSQFGWRLHLGWKPWILSRVADGSSSSNFLRVKRLTDGKIDFGPAPAVSLLDMLWGLLASSPHCWDLLGGHIITGVGIRGQK